MVTAQSLRRVPWTCRWGRFGGPVQAAGAATQGFVFWVCGHPQEAETGRPLDREACERCPNWEPVNAVRRAG
jgi:hypothetical protein